MTTDTVPSPFRLHHVRLLRELRLKAQISQTDLAERLGRHRTWVNKMESGHENVSIESVSLLRSALIEEEADMAPLLQRIAGNITAARARLEPKLSQEAVSAKAGCDLRFVGRLEIALSGGTLDSLGRVVDVLGLDYDQVFSPPPSGTHIRFSRMKKLLDIEAAREKVLNDALACVARIREIALPEFSTAAEGVKVLRTLRTEAYENLNQIQHEHMVLCALEWLAAKLGESTIVEWSWNPRQTGTNSEPDLRGVKDGEIMISAEITTSQKPIGTIATRMQSTLEKLAQMPGQKYYFVATQQMQKLASTKVASKQWGIEVVLLED